jgi:hypothetical protein
MDGRGPNRDSLTSYKQREHPMLRNLARAASIMTLACACSATVATAQEAVLAEFYGTGVHQYFAGNYGQSISDLTAAIDGGTKDPRAFYFRALAEMKSGQQDMATIDLQMGAALETADVNQFYPVAKALERVQGSTRLAIERYRAVARAEAHERQQRRESIRYEQRRRAEAEVLRNPKFAPAGQPPAALPAPAGRPAVAPPPPAEDPFAEDAAAKPTPKPPVAKPPVAEPPEDMPSEEPAADEAPAKPDDDNPFGDEKDPK